MKKQKQNQIKASFFQLVADMWCPRSCNGFCQSYKRFGLAHMRETAFGIQVLDPKDLMLTLSTLQKGVQMLKMPFFNHKKKKKVQMPSCMTGHSEGQACSQGPSHCLSSGHWHLGTGTGQGQAQVAQLSVASGRKGCGSSTLNVTGAATDGLEGLESGRDGALGCRQMGESRGWTGVFVPSQVLSLQKFVVAHRCSVVCVHN